MALLQTIEFGWWRDRKGYRLAETEGRRKLLCVVRNGRGNKDLEFCRPLDRTSSLFHIFASTATTPEGVLNFIQSYGPLDSDDEGQIVFEVIHHAQRMQSALTWISQPQLRRKHTFGGSVPFRAWIDWDPVTSTPLWRVRPSTLLDGLWLQFGQAVTRGVHIRSCAHCGDLFETGLGTGRRLDAKFCSDEHRIAFNSLKRSREK